MGGEDRRATQNTIDESVWDTLSRDLVAVWEKMRQVLWPKYLLGGMMQRGGSGTADAEQGGVSGFGRNIRGLVGRWPDADVVLQGGMSDGLRDWDLWYDILYSIYSTSSFTNFFLLSSRGPLVFCLVLSLFLSVAKGDQSSVVFSGVFCIVWIGEAAVTLQIKLLGGKMYEYMIFPLLSRFTDMIILAPSSSQFASLVTRYSPWLLQQC
jgi:hypothetical protein